MYGFGKKSFAFGDWQIETNKGKILESQGARRERYEQEIKLPHLPDMLFADNILRLQHRARGFGVEFNALDSLKLVDPAADLIKVSVAKEWKETRNEFEFIDKMVHPFDWTFTTPYKGTLIGANGAEELEEANNNNKMSVSETDECINIEKLKIAEQISFFDEVTLFEDELSDHGTSSLNIKIRLVLLLLFNLTLLIVDVVSFNIQLYILFTHFQESCRRAFTFCCVSFCAWTTS